MKPWCYWSVGVVGDGTATSVTLNLLTDPFVIGGATAAGSGPQLALTFSIGLSNLPSSIDVLSCSDGQSVTTTLGILGAVTFSWPNAVPNGQSIYMYGHLTF
jgi:hypothetical protein